MELTAKTIYTALRDIATRMPDAPAITDNRNAYSFSQLVSAIDTCAAMLQEKGIKKGDHVALWSFNSANWYITWCGIMRLGAVAVLLNYNLPVAELANLMQRTDTHFLAWGENKSIERGGEKALHELLQLSETPESATFDVSAANRDFKENPAVPVLNDPELDEGKLPAFIIFTSGSTSKPKPVLVPERCYIADAKGFPIATELEVEHETLCLCAPMFHCLGSQCATKYILHGSHIVMPKMFKPDYIAECFEKYHPTAMAGVGTVYTSLMEVEGFEKRVAPYLKVGFVAGGSLSQTQLIRFETVYHNATFLNAYGQTETAVDISNPSVHDSIAKRSTTVGKPFPGKDVRIFDEQEGFLPVGRSGEIVVHDDGNVMLGYYGMPEVSAIDENGWLHTGDLGYIDKEGYLHLAGRIKDIIIKGGENIAPLEIEKKIAEFDYVREVKVMGAPHPVYGETIVACITVTDPALFQEAEMIDTLKDSLASFKVPSFIFCFDSFPLNDNNKIDQRTLKSMMLARMHAYLLEEQLYSGLSVVHLTLKNTAYNIVPVAALVEEEALRVGFTLKRSRQIRTAAEDFLTERILNAYSNVGDIDMDICFMADWFRLRFSDNGELYEFQKNKETNESAKRILDCVDSFGVYEKGGKQVYYLDFLYDKDFDIRQFLLEHQQKD